MFDLFKEGIADALGFVVGCLLGYGLGRLIGWDIFAQGYGLSSMGAIALVGIGGGIGLQAAREILCKSDTKE